LHFQGVSELVVFAARFDGKHWTFASAMQTSPQSTSDFLDKQIKIKLTRQGVGIFCYFSFCFP
jgi:hypothetical protein